MSSVLQTAEALIEAGVKGVWQELKAAYEALHGKIALDEADWKEVEEKVNASPEPARNEPTPANAPDHPADAASTESKTPAA